MSIFRAHTSYRLITATCAVLAACALPATSSAAESGADGFGVSPMRVDVNTGAGQSSTHQIVITNTDSVATTYTFSKQDFRGDKSDPNATPTLLGGKFTSDISGYDWIDAPDSVTVPAGQQRTVSVKVSVPAGAVGGHYAALIISGGQAAAGELRVQSRSAVLFLMNAGGVPPPDIVITEVKEVSPTRTVTRYINDGQTDTTPKATVTVRDPLTNKIIRRAVGTCSTALPGGSGVCEVDESGPGTTVSDGGIQSGAEQKFVDIVGDPAAGAAQAELPAEWAGAWSSLLLPLVGVTLFVLYFLFLRRRRKVAALVGEDFELG